MVEDWLSAKLIEARFRERVDSVANDVRQCLIVRYGLDQPAPAPFPAVMYCFATLDYFSAHWAGSTSHKGQSARMRNFVSQFFEYGRLESFLAVEIWRHKLMHTSEPRKVRDKRTGAMYGWLVNEFASDHMVLVQHEGVDRLAFNPLSFAGDLERAIFGPGAYFDQLCSNPKLQANCNSCIHELENYEVDTSVLE